MTGFVLTPLRRPPVRRPPVRRRPPVWSPRFGDPPRLPVGYVTVMRHVLALFLCLSSSAIARPAPGSVQVVVVMKMATCTVCAGQLVQLAGADLGVPVVGITHDSQQLAVRVTAATGVATFSHPEGIVSMGLWLADQGIAQPAVVVYDRCGGEAGRVVGRRRDVRRACPGRRGGEGCVRSTAGVLALFPPIGARRCGAPKRSSSAGDGGHDIRRHAAGGRRGLRSDQIGARCAPCRPARPHMNPN
jgi:hypothetical protein